MKTIFLSTVHNDPWPGSEYLWSETAGRLLKDGDQVSAKLSRDFIGAKKLAELEMTGASLSYFNFPQSRLGRMLSRYNNQMSDLDTASADVLVLSSGSAFDLCYQENIYNVFSQAPCPKVFICHFNAETFPYTESERVRMKTLLENTDKLVFVCQENADLLERQLAMEFRDYSVIGPPLNLHRDKPLPWSPPIDRSVVFATVARLATRWKGQDVLFELLAAPKWKARNWRLKLYGRGADKDYLKELAEHYGIQDRVELLGHIDDREKMWLETDIQLLATRGEGGPMVITEAMACGRISVTTRCGHNRDLIQDGVNGFLADFATAFSFDRALEEAWQRVDDWGKMGQAAYQTYVDMRDHDPAGELKSLIKSFGS